MKPKDFSHVLRRVSRSLAGRKKTYSTSVWAFFKQKRKKLKRLGSPGCFIWIVGCQRSGTTLLERIFRQDLDSEVFGEFSPLTIGPDKTSLKPLTVVENILSKCNARYAVIRPLFESDRINAIMDFFQPSVAVWMFREPLYVVNSMINKWGDQFFNISRCVESDSDGSWRLESLYQEIKQEAKQLTGTDENINDLYALYWLKRNEIVLQQEFNLNNKLLLLDYKTLVCEPKRCVDIIMKRAGGLGTWKYFSTDAHKESMNRQFDLKLSRHVKKLCEDFYLRLTKYQTEL